MLTDQEKSEHIERYLSGEMSGTEREVFEAALRDDPALAGRLELHRALQGSLGNRQRRDLLDALADVVEQEKNERPAVTLTWFSPFRLAAAAAVLVLVAAVGFWVYQHQNVEAPRIATPAPSAPQPAPDSARTAPPPAPSSRPADPGPLASADPRAFSANPALDPLVGTLVRGGSADVSVSAPENDAVFSLRNGKIEFILKGTAGAATALTLRIYNNREADFAAGKTAAEAGIPVLDHAFSWNKRLELAPGRYYAVLSEPGDEEPVLVLRFFAGGKK